MGKVILLEHVSLDGFSAGSDNDISWIKYDSELEDYVTEIRKTVDATIYGRITYKMMENYWPSVLMNPESPKNQLEFADWLDKKLKIVVSRTLPSIEWKNTKLIRDNLANEINQLKRELEGNMLLIGSPTLVQSFIREKLIDEYRINVNPVIIGRGIPLFENINERANLKLLNTRIFNSGVVGLHYGTV
jgi:dihydrofolate reductase